MCNYLKICVIAAALWINPTHSNAQQSRFSGDYPLATPLASSEAQLKADYEMTLAAISGGIDLIERETTPTSNKGDAEAYTKQDYKNTIEEMVNYGLEIRANDKTAQENLKKISKLVKSGKYEAASEAIQDAAEGNKENVEKIYFIWKQYLADRKAKAPWVDPANTDITKLYRSLLDNVSKNFDRPFGVQAEQGGVAADAAQALSYCMESPESLAWKGEGKITLKKEDALRKLASDVAFLEWRLHDPVNGQRSATISPDVVRHIQKSLYDVVATMVKDKENWHKDEVHGQNLLQLYHDSKTNGWNVDGGRATKGTGDKTTRTTTESYHTGRGDY